MRRGVVAFARDAGLADADLHGLSVAVSEALSNVVMHAYPGLQDGVLRVNAEVRDGALLVCVRDFGTGVQARGREGGLGLGLIARLTHRLGVHRCRDGGTELRMSFALGGRRESLGIGPEETFAARVAAARTIPYELLERRELNVQRAAEAFGLCPAALAQVHERWPGTFDGASDAGDPSAG